MTTLTNEQLNRSIDLWIDITGVDPDSNSWGDVQSINEQLKEAQILDPTGVTVQMMLGYYAEQYLSYKTFTPNEMLEDPEKMRDYLNKSVELKGILDSPELNASVDSFKDVTRNAIKQYGGWNENVEEVLNGDDFAFIRRDALRALKELKTYQFLQGDPDATRPKYNEFVSEFWNTNSLIEIMTSQMVSGISLVMIKTEDIEFTYFGFAIRNGGTVTLITDLPTYPHPDSKYMKRGRGTNRDFEKRAFHLRFPYSLFDITYDEKDHLHVKEKTTTNLVPRQKVAHQLKKVTELEPDELIWTVMMFDLIVEKFWEQNHQTKELAYTGEMINNNRILIDSNATKGLALKKYCPLETTPLTTDDITTEKMLDEWRFEPPGNNTWMEERYGDKVKTSILNIIHDGERGSLKLTHEGNFKVDKAEEDESYFAATERKKGHFGQLRFVDPGAFGTKTELEFHRRWAARYNKAQTISCHAQEEFDEREEEIKEWFESHVKNNDKIFEAVARGEFMTSHQEYIGSFDYKIGDEKKNIMNTYYMPHNKNYYDTLSWSFKQVRLNGGFTPNGHHTLCYHTGTKAEIAVTFHPMCPHALADLAGVTVDDLPDVLQHWYENERYSGNSILDNVDPMEWVAKNPWKELKFGISVFLSKTGYNKLRKKYGLKPNKFWLKEEPNE